MRCRRASPGSNRNDADQSCLSFLRRGSGPNDLAIIVCNFTPVPRLNYRLGVPFPGRYLERLNTDASEYGGSGMGNAGEVHAEAGAGAWSGTLGKSDPAAAIDGDFHVRRIGLSRRQ